MQHDELEQKISDATPQILCDLSDKIVTGVDRGEWAEVSFLASVLKAYAGAFAEHASKKASESVRNNVLPVELQGEVDRLLHELTNPAQPTTGGYV